MNLFFVQNTAAVKTRLNLGSPGCSFGWSGVTVIPKMVYYTYTYYTCLLPYSDTLFQTRQDQEFRIICRASLLHNWHWVLCSFGSLLLWAKAHKHKRSWRFLPVFILPNMFGLRLCLPNIRSCLLSSASKYKVPFQPAKSYLDRDLQNRSEFYQVIISIM